MIHVCKLWRVCGHYNLRLRVYQTFRSPSDSETFIGTDATLKCKTTGILYGQILSIAPPWTPCSLHATMARAPIRAFTKLFPVAGMWWTMYGIKYNVSISWTSVSPDILYRFGSRLSFNHLLGFADLWWKRHTLVCFYYIGLVASLASCRWIEWTYMMIKFTYGMLLCRLMSHSLTLAE